MKVSLMWAAVHAFVVLFILVVSQAVLSHQIPKFEIILWISLPAIVTIASIFHYNQSTAAFNTYLKRLLVGVRVVGFSIPMLALTWYLWATIINPDFFASQLTHALERIKADGLTREQGKIILATAITMNQLPTYPLIAAFTAGISGLVASFMAAAFVKPRARKD